MRRRNLPFTALAALIRPSAAAQAQDVAQMQDGSLDAVIKPARSWSAWICRRHPCLRGCKSTAGWLRGGDRRDSAKDLGGQLQIVPNSAANRIPYLVTGRLI